MSKGGFASLNHFYINMQILTLTLHQQVKNVSVCLRESVAKNRMII
ncbi:hypothetical protein D1AOALGA4SA_6946 [Olavius algarvensis Delta 1 endosymbiont]|nr:hypothetical protein D1AOALGA4SA_6946 [Olavius algarvensis Delta 1 endosymbiont]